MELFFSYAKSIILGCLVSIGIASIAFTIIENTMAKKILNLLYKKIKSYYKSLINKYNTDKDGKIEVYKDFYILHSEENNTVHLYRKKIVIHYYDYTNLKGVKSWEFDFDNVVVKLKINNKYSANSFIAFYVKKGETTVNYKNKESSYPVIKTDFEKVYNLSITKNQ